MPKNPFQRPQPINRNHNVPRHGQPQQQPARLPIKPKVQEERAGPPPLEKLFGNKKSE